MYQADAAKILYGQTMYSPELISSQTPAMPTIPSDRGITRYDVGPNVVNLITRYAPLLTAFLIAWFILEHKKK
jgi:hypothetical protein